MASCKGPSARALAVTLLAFAMVQISVHAAPPRPGVTKSPGSSQAQRTLQRSNGKRWQQLKEFVEAEVKVSTKKFLEERQQRLTVPLEVDVMMVGLDSDGAFHYQMDPGLINEVMSSTYVDRELCPTIWSTGKQAPVCSTVSIVDLPVHDYNRALPEIETVLRQNMKLMTEIPRYNGAPESEPRIRIYDIDAAQVEIAIHSLLVQAYRAEGFDTGSVPFHDPYDPSGYAGQLGGRGGSEHRMAVVILNPSKLRMDPLLTVEEGRRRWLEGDIIKEWKQGKVNSSRVMDVEGGYQYRYSYNGKGTGQAWVSAYNFVVIDLSAGPVDFGPLTSVSGMTAPARTPRIAPTLSALAMEVEDAPQITLRESLLHDALEAQKRGVAGELASAVAAVVDHVFAPDVLTESIEVSSTVLVSLIVLQDHEEFHLLDHQHTQIQGVEQEIQMDAVQRAVEDLMPKETACVIMPSERRLHTLPEVLMAISRARVTWSDAVMLEQPYLGLHHSRHTRLDSQMLITELKRFVPAFTGNSWAYEINQRKSDKSRAAGVVHNGLRHVAVIVLSLESAPPGLMFENGELVAADHDMVVVLQLARARSGLDAKQQPKVVKLLPKPQHVTADHESAAERLRLYSGHSVDGQPLELDGARGVTAHVIAGLMQSLGGVPPPWMKADPDRPTRYLHDWRWAVGCVPYGPYANCTHVSGVFKASARRNQVISHIETAVTRVQDKLDDVDSLVSEIYEGPWPEFVGELVPSNLNQTRIADHRHRHWMDVLNSKLKDSPGGVNPSMVVALENELAQVESYIYSLSWSLYAQSWDEARQQVQGLLEAADNFTAHAESSVAKCRLVAECCSVRHGRPLMMDTLFTVLFIFIMLLFACVVVVILASRNVYKPRKSGGGSGYTSGYGGGYNTGYGGSGGYSAAGKDAQYQPPQNPPPVSAQQRYPAQGSGGLLSWGAGAGSDNNRNRSGTLLPR